MGREQPRGSGVVVGLREVVEVEEMVDRVSGVLGDMVLGLLGVVSYAGTNFY